jgi:2-iminobutanoate/2-iminopropanoate deaminase
MKALVFVLLLSSGGLFLATRSGAQGEKPGGYARPMLRQVHSTPNAPGAIGPYSQAIRAEGKLLFISGQIPLRPDGSMAEGDVKVQAEQVMKNIEAVLESAGFSPKNVVKTTIFLSDMKHFAAVNEVYAKTFDSEPPARSTVAVAGLPRGVDVEIETIAVY